MGELSFDFGNVAPIEKRTAGLRRLQYSCASVSAPLAWLPGLAFIIFQRGH